MVGLTFLDGLEHRSGSFISPRLAFLGASVNTLPRVAFCLEMREFDELTFKLLSSSY